jgi:hypothetical protein
VYFLGEDDARFRALRARLRLEHGLLLATICILTGLALLGVVVGKWASRGFGALGEERLTILGATAVTLGVQIFFTSFLLSVLGLRRGRDDP